MHPFVIPCWNTAHAHQPRAMEQELSVQRCVFVSTYIYCLGTYMWASFRLCGRVMTVLPCASQRGGLVNTGVFSKSCFESFFFSNAAGYQITFGLIFTSCLLKLTHPSDNRLHPRVILSSDLLSLSSRCLLGQLRGLINEWRSFACQQMPAVLCWF